MRKVTKSAIVCGKCGSVLTNEEYDNFCDYCKNKVEEVRTEITVFWKDSDNHTTRREFCSLKCARTWLLKFPYNKEKVDFITLPYIFEASQIDELLKGDPPL